MTEKTRDPDRDARLRAAGIDPESVVDERDVPYLLGDGLRQAGIDVTPEEQDAVLCTLVRYRLPDTLAPGDAVPDLRLHSLDDAEPAVALGQLHATRPLVLFFGSYT